MNQTTAKKTDEDVDLDEKVYALATREWRARRVFGTRGSVPESN